MSFRQFGISLVAVTYILSTVSNAAWTQDVVPKTIVSDVESKAKPSTSEAETKTKSSTSKVEAKPKPSTTVVEDKQKTTSEEASKPEVAAPQPIDPLMELVNTAIMETSKRRLTAGVHTPWQIVHGILALRWEMNLVLGKGQDEINAIEWMASGPSFDGLPLWEATPFGGRGHPFTRPYAFEGHPTQFMGYMTMADIPLDYKFKTGTREITIRDIINDAKMQVREGPEITWTLWAVSHYEDPETEWINSAGEPWSIERMVRIQVNESVNSGACGGTHGLFALSYARNMYFSTRKPLRGTWLEADQKIKRYIMEAKSLQNADGSFSSNHFDGPGFSNEFTTRIATSGHQLEWLMIALPQSKLKEEWLRKGIENVARDLIAHRKDSSDCGPLYHGLHALIIYRQRTVPGFENPRPKNYMNLRMTDARKSVEKPGQLPSPPVPKLKKAVDDKPVVNPSRPDIKVTPEAKPESVPAKPTDGSSPSEGQLKKNRRRVSHVAETGA